MERDSSPLTENEKLEILWELGVVRSFWQSSMFDKSALVAALLGFKEITDPNKGEYSSLVLEKLMNTDFSPLDGIQGSFSSIANSKVYLDGCTNKMTINPDDSWTTYLMGHNARKYLYLTRGLTDKGKDLCIPTNGELVWTEEVGPGGARVFKVSFMGDDIESFHDVGVDYHDTAC